MDLPDDDPQVVNGFAQWLCKGCYTLSQRPDEMNRQSFDLPIKLLIFSDKYGVTRFRACILQTLKEYATNVEPETIYLPSDDAMKYAYNNTCRGSGIRMFLADWWAHTEVADDPEDDEDDNDADRQFFLDLPEFAIDVIDVLDGFAKPKGPNSFYECPDIAQYTDEVTESEGSKITGGTVVEDGSGTTRSKAGHDAKRRKVCANSDG